MYWPTYMQAAATPMVVLPCQLTWPHGWQASVVRHPIAELLLLTVPSWVDRRRRLMSDKDLFRPRIRRFLVCFASVEHLTDSNWHLSYCHCFNISVHFWVIMLNYSLFELTSAKYSTCKWIIRTISEHFRVNCWVQFFNVTYQSV